MLDQQLKRSVSPFSKFKVKFFKKTKYYGVACFLAKSETKGFRIPKNNSLYPTYLEIGQLMFEKL